MSVPTLAGGPRSATVERLLAELAPAGAPVPAVSEAVLAADVGLPEAVAVLEHACGVRPLLDLLDEPAHPTVTAVRAGDLPGALAVFTPDATLALPVPAVRARRGADGIVLDGRYRYGNPAAAAALVLVEAADGPRLCLVRHDDPGVRTTGTDGWGWADLSGATVDPALLSRPVSWDPAGPLLAALDAYAWAYVPVAAAHAVEAVAQLRRELADPAAGVLAASQYLAHELTRLDIELALLASAARFGPRLRGEGPGGTAAAAVLTACATLTHRTAQVAADFATELGVPGGPAANPAWRTAVQAPFGGRRMAEGELARRMGLLAERS
ncbi:hypothetical protein ACFFMM_19305 [Micromonospora chaiyaphumensis]|uniref:Acyl-CoA dehydrogenase n=1 Tax=Micromonospora chaiyaphumensis TaxID=307119 RepID=A0A1C4VZP4_9ACTN|nr:hypothetical protein [Micromonospora chaiyaphumensis]SCE89442.1 hypothetical protein GA0070214_10369 [Micromonospora chaiyaphumensis]